MCARCPRGWSRRSRCEAGFGSDGVTAWDWSLVGATFLLAGTVKGVIGLGLPTVAVGLLGLVMAPAEAASWLIVPSMVTNVWQLAAGPRFGALSRRLWPMLAGIVGGTALSAGALAADPGGRASAALGLALIAYAVLGLSAIRLHVPARCESFLGPLAGVATGIVTGTTGVSVIPSAPYIAGLGLERDDLVQALGLAFTVSTAALGLALAAHGVVDGGTLAHSPVALAPALAGMAAGTWLRGRISPALFRRCFFAGLLLLGLDLAARGLA